MREFELNAPKRKIGELSQPPPADDGKRSRRQVQGKPSPLDSHAGVEVVVPGAPEFKYSLGGAEVGGAEAERVLREVEVDEGVQSISLRLFYSPSRQESIV